MLITIPVTLSVTVEYDHHKAYAANADDPGMSEEAVIWEVWLNAQRIGQLLNDDQLAVIADTVLAVRQVEREYD